MLLIIFLCFLVLSSSQASSQSLSQLQLQLELQSEFFNSNNSTSYQKSSFRNNFAKQNIKSNITSIPNRTINTFTYFHQLCSLVLISSRIFQPITGINNMILFDIINQLWFVSPLLTNRTVPIDGQQQQTMYLPTATYGYQLYYSKHQMINNEIIIALNMNRLWPFGVDSIVKKYMVELEWYLRGWGQVNVQGQIQSQYKRQSKKMGENGGDDNSKNFNPKQDQENKKYSTIPYDGFYPSVVTVNPLPTNKQIFFTRPYSSNLYLPALFSQFKYNILSKLICSLTITSFALILIWIVCRLFPNYVKLQRLQKIKGIIPLCMLTGLIQYVSFYSFSQIRHSSAFLSFYGKADLILAVVLIFLIVFLSFTIFPVMCAFNRNKKITKKGLSRIFRRLSFSPNLNSHRTFSSKPPQNEISRKSSSQISQLFQKQQSQKKAKPIKSHSQSRSFLTFNCTLQGYIGFLLQFHLKQLFLGFICGYVLYRKQQIYLLWCFYIFQSIFSMKSDVHGRASQSARTSAKMGRMYRTMFNIFMCLYLLTFYFQEILVENQVILKKIFIFLFCLIIGIGLVQIICKIIKWSVLGVLYYQKCQKLEKLKLKDEQDKNNEKNNEKNNSFNQKSIRNNKVKIGLRQQPPSNQTKQTQSQQKSKAIKSENKIEKQFEIKSRFRRRIAYKVQQLSE